MKRHLVIVIVGLSVLGLAAGCGGSSPTPTPTTPPTVTLTTGSAGTPTPTAPASATTPTPEPTPTSPTVDPIARGKSLSARNGCAACHSADGSAAIGPTWQGLYAKEETLADGTRVTVDDAYLIEAIVDPDATIVKGFSAGIMPKGFGDRLKEEDIQAIIEYIKTLSQ